MRVKYMELISEIFNGNEVIEMVDLKKLQKEIYQNKVDKGFNVTDVNKEFCLIYGEVAEAYGYNESAIKFYEKNGYHIRVIDMIED